VLYDFTLISRFRELLGEEGVWELLAKTIARAIETGLIKPEELKRAVVDSTVMPKAMPPYGLNALRDEQRQTNASG